MILIRSESCQELEREDHCHQLLRNSRGELPDNRVYGLFLALDDGHSSHHHTEGVGTGAGGVGVLECQEYQPDEGLGTQRGAR